MTQQEVLLELIKRAEEACILRKGMVNEFGKRIIELANVMSGVIGSGGKIMIAGNGGSSAMSSHFAAELIVRLSAEHNRQSLPGLALTADTAVITAGGNDYGFESIFARQIEGLGNRGDMLVVMSTSGNSENLIRAIQVARQKHIITCGLLGGDGGKLATMTDKSIVIPHLSTQRIQEEHLFIVHQLVEIVERDLFA